MRANPAMKAVSLFLIFMLAKLAVLSGHSVPLSAWALAAYFWQDALVALLFAVLEWSLPSRAVWILYGMIALYTTVNIPVGRALATPLTRPMLRAARGPLSASFLVCITWTNMLLVLLVLAAAAFLPNLLRRSGGRFWAAAGVLVVATGPMAAARVDTVGWDRNVLLAVLSRTHVDSRASGGDWRQSRFPQPAEEDLSYLRGSAKGRNVIMISLESTAAQYLPLYGGAYDVTPNLDAFTQNAIVFDNAYAVYPESIKGLHSVLCSAFPAFGSVAEDYEKVPCRSIAQVLAEAGYRTAMFHSGRFEYLGMESVIRNRGFQTLEDAGDIGGNHNSSFGVDEPSTVARILSWIDCLPKDQRFFLTYLPIAGHHPYDTPQRGPFPDADEIGRYRNALHYGDVSLGTLFDGLRARGLDRNTLWVIYGDHGEAFGQHQGNYS
jgi:glucan phosphoethanolaminetransferase (alkaline phosphatase superfamily)